MGQCEGLVCEKVVIDTHNNRSCNFLNASINSDIFVLLLLLTVSIIICLLMALVVKIKYFI